ncbi:MAG: hypothetical protein AAF468_16000 [Pseudomonadota bacterium]
MTTDLVTILGSGPNAVDCKPWNKRQIGTLVAINNAWRVRPDWDHLVHAGDFPPENMPEDVGKTQSVHTYDEYVPIQNRFGGFLYAGGTMAYTAAYWALGALKPRLMAFLGCDMVYASDGSETHFYGTGEPDPLRDDPTLHSLEAKCNRLIVAAHEEDCVCLNLSSAAQSRLTCPRSTLSDLNTADFDTLTQRQGESIDWQVVADAMAREKALGYMVPSGDYWNFPDAFDAAELRALDGLWKKAL